ncbi:MAG: hypothetical protein V7459_11840 [Oceanicoccus sp.]
MHKSFIRPWTERVFTALPGNHMAIGCGFFLLMLLSFLLGRYLVDGGVRSNQGDFRLTLIHLLLAAYSASAYAYVLSAARNTAIVLKPLIAPTEKAKLLTERIGKHLWWGLLLAGLSGLLINIYATNITTTGSDPWVWDDNNYDSLWMRVLGLFMTWCLGCFFYVLVVESARFSNLCENIAELDIFDLAPFQPLLRQGLTHALLVVGGSSILALFLLEPGYFWLMVQLLTLFAIFAWIGLMLPLRGIRHRIHGAKETEMNWCRQALKQARIALKSDAAGGKSISEIAAYKTLIEDVRNLPFDNPTLGRFGLYLLIPIGSMFGGAFVERGLDLFLN